MLEYFAVAKLRFYIMEGEWVKVLYIIILKVILIMLIKFIGMIEIL